ncbi:MAG: hypothetical protein M3P91_07345 [Actinomycetota bacterium]|nr:hypothetical protein [Actinomycetota bacterium]
MTAPSRRRRSAAGEVTVRRPDPAAWQAALTLADGDPRRITFAEDGTITVHNQPVR